MSSSMLVNFGVIFAFRALVFGSSLRGSTQHHEGFDKNDRGVVKNIRAIICIYAYVVLRGIAIYI